MVFSSFKTRCRSHTGKVSLWTCGGFLFITRKSFTDNDLGVLKILEVAKSFIDNNLRELRIFM